jgi:superfamily I DNA/RNA helicase
MKLPNSEDLDEQQIAVFMAGLKEDLLVCGPPGTGKTVMALYRAQMISRLDKRTKFWVIMYNRLLRRYTENNLDAGGFKNGGLIGERIRTMHQWIYAWGKSWGWGSPEIAKFVYDWDEVIRRLIGKESRIQRRATNWNHIIIDEGQDFAPGFYKMLQIVKMLGETFGQKMALTVFADENQRIHEGANSSIEEIRKEIEFSKGVATSLTINYRNSKQIAELAANFYVGLPTGIPDLPDREGGVSPSLLSFSSHRNEIGRIATFAQQNEDLTVGIIVENNSIRESVVNVLRSLLSAAGINVQTYDYSKTNDELVVMELEKPGAVVVLCGASCKGLEFDAVFITSLEKYSLNPSLETEFRMNMYVRISRAREYLFLSYVSSGGQRPKILEYLPKNFVEKCEHVASYSMPSPVEKGPTSGNGDLNGGGTKGNSNDALLINGFTLAARGKAILVKGNTFPIKEEIKAMGGKWFRTERCWMFGRSRRAEVIDLLKRQI